MKPITIIGAGLAGSEAAWQVLRQGIPVVLYEMRPQKMTPAHESSKFAELVCSNSLRGVSLTNAVGLLKEEMRQMDSLIIRIADVNAIPAGGALAVDRNSFSAGVTAELTKHPLCQVIRKEVDHIPAERPLVLATGPLTSSKMAAAIERMLGDEGLYFYDAVAPIVEASSIDYSKVFAASRYGKGGDDYLNAPMTEEEYYAFWEQLVTAEGHAAHDFEEGFANKVFEGCMPVEVMAARGRDTLKFGPLKPVGLVNPHTGQEAYAVVQLRRDNASASLYNIVGFQTQLKWPEQDRVLRMVPGLENVNIVRYGVMHRNIFINSPRHLQPTLQLRNEQQLFIAGQMSGVEGYVESAACGLVAGLNAVRLYKGNKPLVFPPTTALGALCKYITTADEKRFQPMNINFGLIPSLNEKLPRKEKKEALSRRALADLQLFITENI